MIILEKLKLVKKMITHPNFLLDYVYFKNSNKMITIDFTKLQELDADPKTLQQINFTANDDRAGNRTMFFIIEEAKNLI